MQQQYEVDTDVRVVIDAFFGIRIYPRCANAVAAPLHSHHIASCLSVDAGSDLETKTSSTPSARLLWLRIIREYTMAAAASSRTYEIIVVVGWDAWLRRVSREAPRHVSSWPEYSQSAQAWMLESTAE